MNDCLIFVSEDTPREGFSEVQIQMRGAWVTLIAVDFSFARRILDFVAETRDNPMYMDMHMGQGRYRRGPEKSVDLSSSFCDTDVTLAKIDEFGDSYVFGLHSSSGFDLGFKFHGVELDALVEGMQSIIDDYFDPDRYPPGLSF